MGGCTRAHGWLPIEGGAAHDVNHLTVLSHDQSQPFMNDTRLAAMARPRCAPWRRDRLFPEHGQAERPNRRLRKDLIQHPPNTSTQSTSDDTPLAFQIAGDLWWDGFTAEITLTNNSSRDLDGWTWTFESPTPSAAIPGVPPSAPLRTQWQLSAHPHRCRLGTQDQSRCIHHCRLQRQPAAGHRQQRQSSPPTCCSPAASPPGA